MAAPARPLARDGGAMGAPAPGKVGSEDPGTGESPEGPFGFSRSTPWIGAGGR